MAAALPLTLEIVTDAVKKVNWYQLCSCLCVPDTKRAEIQESYPADDHKKILVKWWFSTHPAPTWRWLICALDTYTHVADEIRSNVEPVPGMLSTCTCSPYSDRSNACICPVTQCLNPVKLR